MRALWRSTALRPDTSRQMTREYHVQNAAIAFDHGDSTRTAAVTTAAGGRSRMEIGKSCRRSTDHRNLLSLSRASNASRTSGLHTGSRQAKAPDMGTTLASTNASLQTHPLRGTYEIRQEKPFADDFHLALPVGSG